MSHEMVRPCGGSRPRRGNGVNGEDGGGRNGGLGVCFMCSISGEDDWGLSGGGEKMAEEIILGEIERVVKGEGAKEGG